MTRLPSPRLLAALLALLAVGAGCEDSVDPTLGTDQAFSVYGYLDPTADRQALRVVPIGATIGADTSRTLDAEVTSVEPSTGRTVTWRDSVVVYDDGAIGHVFVADYTPAPGAEVEVTVRDADGAASTVTVETPVLARPTVGAPIATISGGGVYPVTISGVPRVIGGRLRLLVEGVPGESGVTTLEVPLGRLPIAGQLGGPWEVRVPFLEAVRTFLQDEGLFRSGLTLIQAEFAPFVANAAWAVPEGGFDLDQIAEPGTFSNVAGGFGFVGAGYWSPAVWTPSTNVQSLAGFEVTNDPAALVAVNEVGEGYIELYNPTQEVVGIGGYIVSLGLAGGTVENVRIDPGRTIDPGEFLLVQGPFAAQAGAAAQLLSGSGRLLKSISVGEDVEAWGAYPDGRSCLIPRTGPDLFMGPVRPSPSGPNRPRDVPFVINEVAVDDGFVEVVSVSEELVRTSLASSCEALQRGGIEPSGAPFRVADEQAGALDLDPLGGWVYLLLGGQVIDARNYASQTPGRSAGRLPDGTGTWTAGLLPTRGAPNALARLGL